MGVRHIDKVTITKGAVLDYEEIVCFTEFDYPAIKKAAEELIGKNDGNKNELRLKYCDEKTGKELILFVRKGYRFGIMQMWILEGICESKDYDEKMESDGTIREWLEVEIE